MERDSTPSKTQRKRAMHDLQALGEALTALSRDQLSQLRLPESLLDAIHEAQRIKGFEARRRQLQYIGRLMREIDPAPLRAQLDAWRAPSLEQAAGHRLAEEWRRRLLAETEPALAELAVRHPDADVAGLRALVHEAQHEHTAGRPPRAYRQLFRAIRAVIGEAAAPGDAD